MATNSIVIKGACEHNLKNINLEIPRDKLVVITGLSGSGKSSLAFDTIYAEGQRRYMESLSSYARQFLGQMDKPNVEYILGLSPAISIDQKTTNKNPRSTVGTVTEIYDYLRLLFANIGKPHCPKCGKPINSQSIDQMVDSVLALDEGTKIQLLAPVITGKKGEHTKVFERTKKDGYVRVRVDKTVYDIDDVPKLDKNKKHTVEIIVDRIIVKPSIRKRLADSMELILKKTEGVVVVDIIGQEEMVLSQNFACVDCGISLGEITPRKFSFNSPFGACPTCNGLGNLLEIDEDLVIPDKTKSLNQDAIVAPGFNVSNRAGFSRMHIESLAKHYGFSMDEPVERLPRKVMDLILYGTNGKKIRISYDNREENGMAMSYMARYDGVINIMKKRYKQTESENARRQYEEYMVDRICPTCKGKRLCEESLSVTIQDKSIYEVCSMSIGKELTFFESLQLDQTQALIARQILKEIKARLGFLKDVGLDYLSLARASSTLSGGESQRIRLATQIGSGLMGVLYVLDEPSIGLHQKDNEKLLESLKHLRDLGNSLIVVEHDEDTMYAADYIVDMGPGAGENGGNVIATGTVDEIKRNKDSITGQYLSGRKRIELPSARRKSDKHISIIGANENNLKNINVNIPLGVFTCVTGVSGSGKSSLINEVLYKTLANKLNRAKLHPGMCERIEGLENLDKIINIDQSPIGKTPRSNPVTYTGAFDLIREVFSNTTEAKSRGYKSGRFSFNVKGGRCESCKGDGIIKIEMHFLPDVYVPCEVCKGKKYNQETLDVKYKGKSIADVLDMTIQEALIFFENHAKIKRKLETLCDVGLGYVKLGQSSTTLSGGEAQRVKLACELSKRSTGNTIYILDEPTTGLHIADVHKLVEVLTKLVDAGNSVVVIEHNLDVIKMADYIIDLGPCGGDKGGQVVACGTPEEIAKNRVSHTGKFLKKILEG
ncbi:MAG: excinuclease ABC subunit UvrA [Clostridiales bacterium]|nr:excinuclease ABC subunit UvrA [Clostridiales bacterium]